MIFPFYTFFDLQIKTSRWFQWFFFYDCGLFLLNMSNWIDHDLLLLSAVNPRYVLRNWMAESAVQKANLNDFSEVKLVIFFLICLLITDLNVSETIVAFALWTQITLWPTLFHVIPITTNNSNNAINNISSINY